MTDNSLIRIFVNKIENRIILRIKKGYYLKFVTHEAIKLFGSTKNKTTKDKNVENAPHLEVNEVAHCNIVNNGYQHNSRIT